MMSKTRLALLSLSLAACNGTSDTSSDPSTIEANLATSYGGVTASPEPEIATGAEGAAVFADPTLPEGDPMADERANLADARRVRILVAWGFFRLHPDATEIVDWSGSLTVTNAALRLVRPARFETATDHVILPRTDIHTIAFESQTRPHWDGLVVDVVLSPDLNPAGDPVTLTFDSAVANASLTIEHGMRRTVVTTVDDAGHKLAYHVIRPDHDGCAEGFLLGRWEVLARPAGHEIGTFFGRFIGSAGEVRGVVRGLFGQRRNGAQLFFGKIVNRDGDFLGVVAGRYGDGQFAGRLLGDDRTVEGSVHGVYGDRDDDGDGFFAGRWSQRCGERPDEGQPDAGDEAAEDLSVE